MLNKDSSRRYLYPVDQEGRVISDAPTFFISGDANP
jgi:hypothetical protein